MEIKRYAVSVLGYGKVGKPLVDLLVKSNLPIDIKTVAVKHKPSVENPELPFGNLEAAINSDSDLYIDCLPYSEETLSTVFALISKGKTIATCNKELVNKHKVELVDAAKASGSKLYFNAIPASSEKTPFSFVNLTEKNISGYGDELYEFRGADGDITAKFLYQDVVRAHHKFNPGYEDFLKMEEGKKAHERLMKLQEEAKLKNLSIEEQPCGIEPKLSSDGY